MLSLILGQLRYLARTPGATAASVAATALGTMSVVAVHLLSEDIKAGLDSAGALPIRGYTHVVRGTDLTWDAYFDARDRWREGHVPRVEAMTPLVEGQALVNGRSSRVLGFDMLVAGRFIAPGAFIEDPSTGDSTRMLLGDGIVAGSSLGLAAGESVRAGEIAVDVVGVSEDAGNVVFADMPTALRILGRTGPGAILVRARGGEPVIERWFPGSSAAFDIGTAIELGQGLTAQALDEAEPTRRFALAILFNLGALGALSLFVAAFLIYQASYSNIARRQRERERLAAIGVGPGTLGLLFVAEGALIGFVGAAAGTLLGALLAGYLASMDSFAMNGIALAKGVLGGVGAGVAGAFLATRRAAILILAFSPLNWTGLPVDLARIGSETRGAMRLTVKPDAKMRTAARRATVMRQSAGPRWVVAALAAALLAAAAMSDTLAAAFALIVASCMLQFSVLMPGIAAVLRRAFTARMGRLNLLARANVRRFAMLLGEVDIAASALSIAIAAAIGMGVQVENFRADFYSMLDQRLWCALYIESERPVDVDWLESLPGVTDARSYGRAEALLNGRPVAVTLGTGDVLESRRYGYGEALEGDVLLSESGALEYGLEVGEGIEVEGARGARRATVAHVFSDYGAPSPRIVGTFTDLGPILDGIAFERTSVLTVGEDTTALQRAIGERYPDAHVRDQSELRALAEKAFDRTFEVAESLNLIALIVAIAGLYNALSALVLRARDDHRLLYAAGVSRVSIAALAVQQNLLIGAVAGAAAVPLGLVIAYVLCAEVNPRAFGWSISFGIDVAAVLTPTLLGIVAALLAGLVPIWRGIKALGGAPEHALL